MADKALSGITIIDFTQGISGPYATKLLADYGATIIKIEQPGVGDIARRMGPFPEDKPHPEKSGMFLFLNTNKKSLTVNLQTKVGIKILRELITNADAIVESYQPGEMDKFGLGYSDVRQINPKLSYISISNFGQTGPYKDYSISEMVLYAMGGEMYSTGLEDESPLMLGPNMSLFQGGAVAAVASLGALYGAGMEGAGQHVDISLMECLTGSIDRRMATTLAYEYTGEITERKALSSIGYPLGVYPCADGYFELVGGLLRWNQVVQMLGNPPELLHPKWSTPEAMQDADLKAEFDEIFFPWILGKTKQELWQLTQANNIQSAPLNNMEDVVADSYFKEQAYFTNIAHPIAGDFLFPGAPWIMNETPWEIQSPAPQLGEHTQELLSDIGYTRNDLVRLREQNCI
jgi:crotonobetainyl-CoA:carnitine CoA-transferase CaiB-like acyl-CoA transferase